jgi:DNA-binding NtrC family response regulator
VNGVTKKQLSPGAVEKIKKNGWRGNIRELENTMHRAILMSMEDQLEADAVHIEGGAFGEGFSSGAAARAPDPAGVGGAGANNNAASAVQHIGAVEGLIGKTIADVERTMILNTLDHCLGNRTHAANILGISIRTLRNKLNQYKDEGADIPAATG